eukprot:335694-Hanusia_phi.AAC.5
MCVAPVTCIARLSLRYWLLCSRRTATPSACESCTSLQKRARDAVEVHVEGNLQLQLVGNVVPLPEEEDVGDELSDLVALQHDEAYVVLLLLSQRFPPHALRVLGHRLPAGMWQALGGHALVIAAPAQRAAHAVQDPVDRQRERVEPLAAAGQLDGQVLAPVDREEAVWKYALDGLRVHERVQEDGTLFLWVLYLLPCLQLHSYGLEGGLVVPELDQGRHASPREIVPPVARQPFIASQGRDPRPCAHACIKRGVATGRKQRGGDGASLRGPRRRPADRAAGGPGGGRRLLVRQPRHNRSAPGIPPGRFIPPEPTAVQQEPGAAAGEDAGLRGGLLQGALPPGLHDAPLGDVHLRQLAHVLRRGDAGADLHLPLRAAAARIQGGCPLPGVAAARGGVRHIRRGAPRAAQPRLHAAGPARLVGDSQLPDAGGAGGAATQGGARGPPLVHPRGDGRAGDAPALLLPHGRVWFRPARAAVCAGGHRRHPGLAVLQGALLPRREHGGVPAHVLGKKRGAKGAGEGPRGGGGIGHRLGLGHLHPAAPLQAADTDTHLCSLGALCDTPPQC